MSAVVVGAGVPKSVLLTHYGGTLIPKGAEPVAPTMKYVGGEIPGLGLGVSLLPIPVGPGTLARCGFASVSCKGPPSTGPHG